MISLPKHLAGLLQKAATAAIPALADKIVVTPERNKDWDYTCPSAMKIYNASKKTGSYGFPTCQELAQAIINSIPADNVSIESVELKQAGGGDPSKAGFFLNITLKNQLIEQEIMKLVKAEDIQIEKDEEWKKETVVVDFSSPNIAKDMHVGHLRSTIIGDATARVLEFLGHDVHRINHLGDWGTQFGMLITELNEEFPDFLDNPPNIQDLVVFYQKSKKRFEAEEEFKKTSYENVVKLQQGDEKTYKAWQLLCKISEQEFSKIYQRLDIRIKNQGESYYNPYIKPMIEDLETRGIIKIDKGAKCIFGTKKKVPPLMVQKSDGGYNYDSTDLAAVRYRVNELGATWLIYVTDEGQKLHFDILADCAQIAGYLDPKAVRFDHMGFGLVLQELKDEESKEEPKAEEKKEEAPAKTETAATEVPAEESKDKGGKGKGGKGGKPEAGKKEESKKPKVGKIKTREGFSTKLMDLLNESKSRSLEIFKQRLQDDTTATTAATGEAGAEEVKESYSKVQVDTESLEKTAEVLGISSIKYFDLKQNRIQNYVFSFDKMLDPKGNTGVYLLYMYVRIMSILRKGQYEGEVMKDLIKTHNFKITNKSEKELAVAVLRLSEQLDLTIVDLQLNRLTDLLYEIAVKIGEFYQQSKVLGGPEEQSRIILLEATRRVMSLLFHLLGMKTIDRL